MTEQVNLIGKQNDAGSQIIITFGVVVYL